MSDSHGDAHGHEKLGFFRSYLWSTNHKVIGKQFLITSLFFLFIAGSFALSLRWQLAYPAIPDNPTTVEDEGKLAKPVPVIGKWLFATAKERAAAAEELAKAAKEGRQPNLAVTTIGAVKPEQFMAMTTMHGLIMIFFVVIPILVGAFGNFLIPLHVGTHDMAFPVLNAASFWVFLLGAIIAVAGLAVPTESGAFNPAAGGWTMYTPLSGVPWSSPGMSTGQTMVLLAAVLVGFSSIMGAVNYMTTILKMRAPGLSMWRLPLTTWAQFITAILQLLATPVLAGALIMLLTDRLLGTSFFLPGGLDVSGKAVEHSGGSVLLWQHIFWFYSHPAVYILVLPAMGIASDLLAVGARKPIFGYKAMVYSIAGIAGLGFIVWAHHMFVSGMNPTLATAFMVSTMMIALPSSIKVFNWLGTLWRGSIRFDVPTLCALSFVSMFIIGGLSGIFMAATPVDIFIHDTYFIVAHFHYVVFGGSLFAVFGGVFFWFPKMYGRMMNPTLGFLHWVGTFVFFNLTFFPMHIIGGGGHMRRIASVMEYDWIRVFQPWNVFITHSALALGFFQILFVFNFFWSMYKGKPAEANPWQANTLEWTIPSPAPEHNYVKPPDVHHGPYEYGVSPDRDYLPQTDSGSNPAGAH
jgi:cytochrome c oxidase subunit 1